MDYSNFTKTTAPKSQVILKGVINKDEILKHRKKAINRLSKEIDLKGFRNGIMPESMVISVVGEETVEKESVKDAIFSVLLEILEANNIFPIIRPEIEINILNSGDAEIKIITTIKPKIILPDYKKIAESVKKTKKDAKPATESEIKDILTFLRREKLYYDSLDEAGLNALEAIDKAKDAREEDLPDLVEFFYEGIDHGNEENLKAYISGKIYERNSEQERNRIKDEFFDKLVEQTTLELPEFYIDNKVEDLKNVFSGECIKLGTTIESVVAMENKTIEDYEKEVRPYAHRLASINVLLLAIFEEEKLALDTAKIKSDVNEIMAKHKNYDVESIVVHCTNNAKMSSVSNFIDTLIK